MIEVNNYSQLRQIYSYLKKQRENQKFLKYLEIAATFILILILLIFAIKPTALAITTLLGEIKSKEMHSQKLKAKIESVIQAQNSYSQVQEKYAVIESSLPSQPEYFKAAANFSNLSKQSSIPLNRISFNLSDEVKKTASNDITSYDIKINGFSSYSSIVAYLNSILNSRRLIDIEDVKLSTENNSNNSNSNEVNLILDSSLFYLKN